MNKIYIYILLFCTFCISCGEESSDLTPAAERARVAIDALVTDLTEPTNGWMLNYRPTTETGTYLMVLKFEDDGLVNIKSDVAHNNGEFSDQTIPYRVDNSLGLELIFETYGVFHFLFEQQQASFGAEFEFIFNSKEGNNLVFQSKTDTDENLTVITLEPAVANAESSLSTEITENLAAFIDFTPQILGGNSSIQHIMLLDQNASVFWTMDLLNRSLAVDIAGSGATVQEIATNTDNVSINHTTGFSFADGKLLLEEPFSFSLNGSNLTIGQVTLENYDAIGGSPICTTGTQNTPLYSGQIPGVGNISLGSTLFGSSGIDFTPQTESSYSVNVNFVFGSDGFALSSNGSINQKFPTSTGFVFNYGLESHDQPANAVGFFLEDDAGIRKIYLREFDVISKEGNMLQISLTNNFYYSVPADPGEEQNLIEVTDEIFDTGEIYAYDFPIDGIKVFNIYNPCNGYEFLLVQ